MVWKLLLAALGGSVLRLLFGLSKAYQDKRFVSFEWKRIIIEIITSFGFGLFAIAGMQSFGIGKIPATLTAGVTAVAGFLGADLLNRMAQQIGINAVETVFQRVTPGISPRQQQALDYASTHGSITNDEYQKRVKVSDATARRDLVGLAKKGLLKQTGTGKGTRYRV